MEKVSPEAVTRLDPFPDSEPFTRLHHRQDQLCQQLGGISLEERIEQFLSTGGTKDLQSVRVEGLKCLQKSLHDSNYDIEHLLKQGKSSYSKSFSLKIQCHQTDERVPILIIRAYYEKVYLSVVTRAHFG